MIKASVSYTEPLVTIHTNPNCAGARTGPGQERRHLLVNADNLSRELARFRDGKVRFSAEPGMDDLWLILDFQDAEFEAALAAHLKRLLGLLHEPLRACELRTHC